MSSNENAINSKNSNTMDISAIMAKKLVGIADYVFDDSKKVFLFFFFFARSIIAF